ncbi:EcsC family protein [Halochromatium sp.]
MSIDGSHNRSSARVPVATGLPFEATRELIWSYRQLEHPSLAARLSDVIASPIGEGLKLLPRDWRKRIDRGVEASMLQAFNLALLSLGERPDARPGDASTLSHKMMAASAGAVGGFFGPLSTLAELPITTTLMMRSIADIAVSEGERLRENPDARLACVQVFALGGRTRDDEDAEVGYYGMRITLGLHFENVIEYVGKSDGPHIPTIINLVRAIAARFGVVVSDKFAAQMVPIAGAMSGAALNLIFMQHYQHVARGHFIVRRLERQYGAERVRDAYRRLAELEQAEERVFSPIEGW